MDNFDYRDLNVAFSAVSLESNLMAASNFTRVKYIQSHGNLLHLNFLFICNSYFYPNILSVSIKMKEKYEV